MSDVLQRLKACAIAGCSPSERALALEAACEIARLRKERLTAEERDAVAGIALVLDRLKLYPEQVGRTKQDDIDLLWRIAEGEVEANHE